MRDKRTPKDVCGEAKVEDDWTYTKAGPATAT